MGVSEWMRVSKWMSSYERTNGHVRAPLGHWVSFQTNVLPVILLTRCPHSHCPPMFCSRMLLHSPAHTVLKYEYKRGPLGGSEAKIAEKGASAMSKRCKKFMLDLWHGSAPEVRVGAFSALEYAAPVLSRVYPSPPHFLLTLFTPHPPHTTPLTGVRHAGPRGAASRRQLAG